MREHATTPPIVSGLNAFLSSHLQLECHTLSMDRRSGYGVYVRSHHHLFFTLEITSRGMFLRNAPVVFRSVECEGDTSLSFGSSSVHEAMNARSWSPGAVDDDEESISVI